MSDLLQQLESVNSASELKPWKGAFRDFLKLYETAEYPNIADLSHRRIEQMIVSAGKVESDYFGRKRAQYKFFEDHLFGIEQTIDELMAYLHSAARKTETARRMLLLVGPVSSGKSDLVQLIKRGLEKYTKTHEGAVFALAGSSMYENPFLLVPEDLRPEFERRFNIRIEGRLNPHSQWRLQHEYHGKFMDFPVEQIFFSEDLRVGIGTWVPSDEKVQDPSELVGSIDFAKIQEYGNEADPRTYLFNGELNVANRGVMEFIEGIKGNERFLRVLLTATQEKQIKAPRFGMISVDCFIIMHTNETEFRNFMGEKKYEAYHDRMVIVKVPYNLGVTNEVKIYTKLLSNSDTRDVHIAPHTLEAAAMVAVLSRIEPPKDSNDDKNMIKKMRLYNGEYVRGYKSEQVLDIRKKSPREGMFGISPRFVIDQIAAAISMAAEEKRNFVTSLDILRQLMNAIQSRDTFKPEDKNTYEHYIDLARREWNEMLRNDIQKAFFLSFEDESRALCERYLEQIEAALAGTKPRDPVTGEERELNEKLMENIESHLDISNSGREDFRNEILRFFGAAARKGKKVDYTEHAQLREAIQKEMFRERQGVIRMTVSSHNPDPEALRRINEVVDRMCSQQGYTPESANALLKYASAELFDK